MFRPEHVFTPRHVRAILREPQPVLDDLQARLCEFTGLKYCVLCSSGSAALYMAIQVSRPDYLHVPASTFPAISEASILARGSSGDPTPVVHVIDCELETWHSVFDREDDAATVHNYGCVSPYNCGTGYRIVDAAAAILTPNAFVHGDVFTVSFNWNKSISGGGGGALLTNDVHVADNAEGLKRHRGEGAFNFQCPVLCAAEVYDQLADADARRNHLRNLSCAYDFELNSVGLSAYPRGTCRWLTGTMFESELARDLAMESLAVANYPCRKPWLPLTSRENAQNAWTIHERGLILPGGYGMMPEQVREVCQVVAGVVK